MKYTKLIDLVQAIRSGEEEGVTIRVDNDCAHAERPTGGTDEWGDPEYEDLWRGDGPETEFIDLLNGLGCAAEGA